MGFTFGVFPNMEKEKVREVLDDLLFFCRERDIKVMLPATLAFSHEDCPRFDIDTPESMKEISVGISLGGDGTFLRMAKYTSALGIPVCGINVGRKGFLTEIEIPQMQKELLKIYNMQYDIEERCMLHSTVMRNGCLASEAQALNDVVLSKGNQARLVRLSVSIDNGRRDSYYSADGLVFSTATGSTAYSLSAGGPIVHPSLSVTVITPVCPHALHTRPLVVPGRDEITIQVQPPYSEIQLAADGVIVAHILPGDVVRVTHSELKCRFIKLADSSYYDTWQQRLQKGEEI